MLETQIAQLAAALPNLSAGKLPGQPEHYPKENVRREQLLQNSMTLLCCPSLNATGNL